MKATLISYRTLFYISFFIMLYLPFFNSDIYSQAAQTPYIINEISGNRLNAFDRNNYGLFPFSKDMEYAELYNNQKGRIDAKIFKNDNTSLFNETNYTPSVLNDYIAFIDRFYNSKNGDLFSEQGYQAAIYMDNGDVLLSQIISVRDSSILISRKQINEEKDLFENNMMSSVSLKDINSIVIKKNNKIWLNVISGALIGSLIGYILNSVILKMNPEQLGDLFQSKQKVHPTTFFTLTFGTVGAIVGALTYANENTMPVKELGAIPVRPYAIYPHQMLEPDFLKKFP